MKDTGTGPSLVRASAVFNAGAQLESVPTRTTFKAFGNQTITPIGTCKFTMVFENRTLTVPAYVFADDKSNYDIIIGNSFSNKRSANINFDGLSYSLLADDGFLINIPGSMGETRFNSSDLQFEVICTRNHYINPMSVNQISVFFREVGETKQYYFQDAVQFFIEANTEKDNLLRVASTLCIAYQDNETLLEVVNATASTLLLKRGRITGNAFIASEELSHIPSINNIEIAKSFISRNATQEDFETEDDSLPPLISDASDWSEESILEQDIGIDEQT